MKIESYKIFPLGIDALTIEFGNEILPALNDLAISLSKYFENHKFGGFIEAVPAYSSVTIFYDVSKVRSNFPDFFTAFAAVSYLVENALNFVQVHLKSTARIIEIPVDFTDHLRLIWNLSR